MDSGPSTTKAIKKISENTSDLNVPGTSDRKKDFKQSIKKGDSIDLNGIVRFFIKDLLKSAKKDNYFIVRSIPFIYVEICGVIVNKHFIRNKISIKVHDGSGVMNCLIDQNYFSKIPPLPNFNVFQTQNFITDAAKMMLSNLKHLHSNFIMENDLTLGNTVILQGKLSEYGGALYVFVDKINSRTTTQYVAYLQTGLQWYKDCL